MAGVPVLFMVATIFCAIIALLPIPVMMTLPFEVCMCCTAFAKAESIQSSSAVMAFASILTVRRAASRILFVLLKSVTYLDRLRETNLIVNCIEQR